MTGMVGQRAADRRLVGAWPVHAGAGAARGLSAAEAPACLAVLMPVYNEALTFDLTLERVLAQGCVKEVIAVDDGSRDGSWARLQQWSGREGRVRVLRHERNRGKGTAIRTALAQATAPLVVIQDADLEYDPADYPRLLEPILRGEAEVVYGSRFGAGAQAQTSRGHRRTNRLLTWAANRITGLRLSDEATCYKLFRRELLLGLELQEVGFGFCPEVTAKLARGGIRIVEVPIRYRARSRGEGKKIRWRHGLQALWCIVKYSW